MRDGVASETARRVAAHRLRCPRVSTTFGRPDDDVALSSDIAAGVEVGEGRMHAYLCRRTSFFDGVVVDALDAGVEQVVTIGAGYDGRALRFCHESTAWYEVDHPTTQADKLERIARLGLSTDGVRFVGVDLTTGALTAGLVRSGFRREVPSLFLVEGVASYLTEDVLLALLGALRSLAADGSQLAISVGLSRLRTDPEALARAAAFREAVAALGEPIRNELSVEGFEALLVRTGWARARPDDADPEAATLGLVLATTSGG